MTDLPSHSGLYKPLYLLRLNYCSWDCRIWGYAKWFSAVQESCVHAIAFRVTPIDSPDCDTKLTYHVILGATGSDLCPVAALLDNLSSRGDAPGPLFMFSDGNQLHRSQFVQEVQRALTASGLTGLNCNSHSFQIGAATLAGAAGVPESTVKVLGFWKSMAYQQYIYPSMDDLTEVSSQLC